MDLEELNSNDAPSSDEIPTVKPSNVNIWRFSFNETDFPKILRLTGFMVASLYVLIMQLLEGVNVMHYFFAGIIILLFIGGSKDFVKFWSPFVVLWLSYDFNHIVTKNFSNPVNVKKVYDFELILTGWFTKGEVLPFVFQRYRIENSNDPFVMVLDLVTAVFYMSHLIAPIIFGILLYRNYRTNVEFKRFVFTFIGVSYAGLVTFLLFPAAPPWYVWNEGRGYNFNIPSHEGSVKDAGGLVTVDKMLGFPFFQTAYESLNSNAYAAIPSIHNAYAIIIAIYAIRIFGKRANFMIIYPLGMAFSSMWLNHHYLLDILWSILYIIIFYAVAKKLFTKNTTNEIRKVNLNTITDVIS
ncbi:MAG: phosphatase PAP2 family protein [Candidatus Kariarchaeaceae archaeon]